jgi:hypothetical protein
MLYELSVPRRGRPADVVWSHYEFNNSRKDVKCKYCSKHFSSPVSITLRAHLSNPHYAKLYKTTLCPMASLDIHNQCVSVLNEKITVTKDKRHNPDLDRQKKTSRKKQKYIQSDEVYAAMLAFVKDLDLPVEVLSSPSFVTLCQTIRDTAQQYKSMPVKSINSEYYVPLTSSSLSIDNGTYTPYENYYMSDSMSEGSEFRSDFSTSSDTSTEEEGSNVDVDSNIFDGDMLVVIAELCSDTCEL